MSERSTTTIIMALNLALRISGVVQLEFLACVIYLSLLLE